MTSWSAFSVAPGEAQATALGEALEALDPAPTGVGVFEIEDGSGLWEIAGWFMEKPDEAGLAILAAVHGSGDFVVSRVEDRDWVAQVRRELHPVDAGRFTIHGAHDSHRVGIERKALVIEAAMAFGTGHHGTTRGCLVLLDRMLKRGLVPRNVADIGCGTGVLAMAAALSARSRCVASDIDEVAAETARENARANRLSPWIRCLRTPGFRNPLLRGRAPYDLVFANILASPLKRLAPDIAAHLGPGGVAVLSGLLVPQVAGVRAVFAGHGLVCRDQVRLGEWASLEMVRTGTRRAN